MLIYATPQVCKGKIWGVLIYIVWMLRIIKVKEKQWKVMFIKMYREYEWTDENEWIKQAVNLDVNVLKRSFSFALKLIHIPVVNILLCFASVQALVTISWSSSCSLGCSMLQEIGLFSSQYCSWIQL